MSLKKICIPTPSVSGQNMQKTFYKPIASGLLKVEYTEYN